MADVTVFLKAGSSGSYTFPADWPGTGYCHIIGAGGLSVATASTANGLRKTGGSGAYSGATITGTAGETVDYFVAAAGSQLASWFRSTSTVLANAGGNATTSAVGAQAPAGVGDVTFAGVLGVTRSNAHGAGGPGSSGPSGLGKGSYGFGGTAGGGGGGSNGELSTAGGFAASAAGTENGGRGRTGETGALSYAAKAADDAAPGKGGGGAGGGGTTAATASGADGAQDDLWQDTETGEWAGPGGGGGGVRSFNGATGGDGGGYGSVGGAGWSAAGLSRPGIIVLVYTPTTGGEPPAAAQSQVIWIG